MSMKSFLYKKHSCLLGFSCGNILLWNWFTVVVFWVAVWQSAWSLNLYQNGAVSKSLKQYIPTKHLPSYCWFVMTKTFPAICCLYQKNHFFILSNISCLNLKLTVYFLNKWSIFQIIMSRCLWKKESLWVKPRMVQMFLLMLILLLATLFFNDTTTIRHQSQKLTAQTRFKPKRWLSYELFLEQSKHITYLVIEIQGLAPCEQWESKLIYFFIFFLFFVIRVCVWPWVCSL